ncbi:hypothetical protein D3C77_216780 [compost metagenome]
MVLFGIIRGVALEVEIGAGIAAVRPPVAGSHCPVTQLGHLPANSLATYIARAGKLPRHRGAVFQYFLIDVPDLDRFLGRVGLRIAAWEIGGIQVLRHGVAYRQLELEQVVERQAQRGDSAVDVANRQRRPHGGTV